MKKVSGCESLVKIDRRDNPRYPLLPYLQSYIEIFPAQGSKEPYEIKGEIENISNGGMKIITKVDLSLFPEDEVKVSFQESLVSYTVQGKIAWRMYDLGILSFGIVFDSNTKKSTTFQELLKRVSVKTN